MKRTTTYVGSATLVVAATVASLWSAAIAAAVVGAAFVAAASPALMSARKLIPWALPVLVGIGFVIVDLRGEIESSSSLRYIGVAVVALTALAVRDHAKRATPLLLNWVLLIFAAYAAIGFAIGRTFLDVQSGPLPLALTAAIGSLGPSLVGSKGLAAPQVRAGATAFAVAGTAYGVMSILMRVGWLDTVAPIFNHEKAFLLVLAVFAAWAARRRMLLVIALTVTLASFFAYPAATYLTAFAASIATLVALPLLSRSSLLRWVTGIAVFLATIFAVNNMDRLLALFSSYFEAVGKTDNGATRLLLSDQAVAEISSAPLFARMFSGELTVSATLAGRGRVELPVHNDYLTVALGGGYIALALFVAAFVLTNGLAARALPHAPDHIRRLLLAVVATINAAATIALANPVFMKTTSATIVFSLFAVAVTLAVGQSSAKQSYPGRAREDAIDPALTRKQIPDPSLQTD